jgi:Alkylmercury lyase
MLGAEGAPAVIHIDDHRVRENLVVHFPIPMTHAWDNVVYTCSTILVFATDTDVDAWSQRHAILRGDVQPIQRVYDFARVWYGRHLEDEWRKWTADEARDLFEHFRFTGRIWSLPASDQRF